MEKVLVREVQDQGDTIIARGRWHHPRGEGHEGMLPPLCPGYLIHPQRPANHTYRPLAIARIARVESFVDCDDPEIMKSERPSERSPHCSSHAIHHSSNTLGALTYPTMPATICRSDIDRRQHCLGV